MRFVLAGIIQLWLISAAIAGVSGKVESIGFGSFLRRDCWTPMLVQVTSDSAVAEEYALQVVQYDLDGDEVVYTRHILVNAGETLPVWAYFKPETVNDGIPTDATGTAADLPKRVRVFLSTPDGSKRIVQLNVTGQMPRGLDVADQRPGEKLIVCAGKRPQANEFDQGRPVGLTENLAFVQMDPRRLPDNVLGYDAVDAVVWTDGDPNALAGSQFRALRQYIRGGGRLVVLQHAETGKMSKLADLLPVSVTRVEEWKTLDPLKSILLPNPNDPPIDQNTNLPIDAFAAAGKGPFHMARATALDEAVVDTWVTWEDGTRTPYIARHLQGQGSVAWVAQDFSEPALAAITHGWPRMWERIFDWQIPVGDLRFPQSMKRDAITGRPELADRTKKTFEPAGVRDLGTPYTKGMDLDSKTAALISIAFIFFIGYWLVAGPGVYLGLAARKKTQWSWFAYGAVAIGATLLTAGVASLVLRGDAQIRHISLVRVGGQGDVPERVFSRFGVYIPSDRADAEIKLTGAQASGATAITPLVIDPRFYSSDASNLRDSRYLVPIHNPDANDADQCAIYVPIRSTLKKMQAQWTGAATGTITGKPRLVATGSSLIAGSITNNSGKDLSQVMIVFGYQTPNSAVRDYVLYLRAWPKGQTLDLETVIAKAWDDTKKNPRETIFNGDARFGSLMSVKDALHSPLRSRSYVGVNATEIDDVNYRPSFPIISLFDRLAPMQNSGGDVTRTDLHRRGVRNWDVSGALAAGAMVVLAQTDGSEIPMPLTVDGDKPEGAGMTFWQFIVPIDRSAVNGPPSTQPSVSGELRVESGEQSASLPSPSPLSSVHSPLIQEPSWQQ